jgi:predicted nucleotidyltransferase
MAYVMKVNNVIESIKLLKPELEEKFGIKQIAIFGSCARGEAVDDSDIDIAIVEMERKNGFLVARAKRFISEKLGKEVDIGLYSAMNPYVKKCIQKDMIYV